MLQKIKKKKNKYIVFSFIENKETIKRKNTLLFIFKINKDNKINHKIRNIYNLYIVYTCSQHHIKINRTVFIYIYIYI